jgi:hypothetical protein
VQLSDLNEHFELGEPEFVCEPQYESQHMGALDDWTVDFAAVLGTMDEVDGLCE